MAKYFKEVFGDMLHVPAPTAEARAAPSPNALKGKVLIKVCFHCGVVSDHRGKNYLLTASNTTKARSPTRTRASMVA